MPRLAHLAVATLSVIGLAGYATPAHADAALAGAPAPSCQVSLNAGTEGITLPSNAPALPLIESSDRAIATVSAELVSPAGRLPFAAPSDDAHGLRILTLPSNAPGAYTVATNTSCSNGMPDQKRETPLTLTAPVDFPSAVGTLVHVPKSPPTGVDSIELEPSPGLRAFLPAAHFRMSIDGAAGAVRYGGPTTTRVSFTAHTGAVCVENGALHREKRTVRISLGAAIAGVAESPTPATLDLTVDCGAIKWTSATDFPGETTPTGSTSSPGTSGGSTSAGGCSAAPVATMSGTAPALAAFALASLVAHRRRRR
jgi:MYXO-CTERM domain-containing protein